MSIITSPEFFINMKSIPTETSSEYDDFVRRELDKLRYGTTINGIFIPPWLYWHINYWKIYRPIEDLRNHEIVDVFANPQLRDNEWMIAEKLEQAKSEKKGLLIVGARRIAKTSVVASWLGLGATIYEGSQNIVVGNNKGDITNITTQMDKGLSGIVDFLKFPRPNNDWSKEVSLGYKDKKGIKYEWSKILIKNTEEGTKTEILAGLTPKTLVYDEIGKAPTKQAFLAGVPAFTSPLGWRCVPILTGTGGDFKNGDDAKEMFNNPERFNLLAIDLPNENRKIGVFISGFYSIDIPKDEVPLSEYLDVEKGSELDIIKIQVSDKERGIQLINDKRDAFLKANDQKEYLKAVMYSPLTPQECFMSDADENPYPVEALKQHLEFLRRTQVRKFVRLYRDVDGKVQYSTDTPLKPVSDFPVTKDSIKEGPIVMYEPPISNPPNFLYIAGGDPYNKDKSVNSPSLGTIYIYKRFYDAVDGTYQNRTVASFASRPETMKDWHQTVELLLELYNATLMIENEGTDFIRYMDGKNKSHWLADGYTLAKEIHPKSSIQGKTKGLPATVKIQINYRNLIVEYCTEKIVIGQRDGGELIEVMGLTRLNDEMLITELIAYKPKMNVDRIVAFGHALIYDNYLQKIAPNIKVVEEEPDKRHRILTVHSPFIIERIKDTPHARRNPFM